MKTMLCKFLSCVELRAEPQNNRAMTRHTWIIVALGLLIALGLRVFIVIAMRDAINVDELSLGVEALSLWQTGRDVMGAPWPLHFYHYGWGENVVYAYLLAPLVGWLGLHAWVLDIPSVIASMLMIAVVWRLGAQLHSRRVGWIAAAILAMSPWSIQLARLSFNASIVPLFWLAGASFVIQGLRGQRWGFGFGALCWAISFYTYGISLFWVPALAVLMGWVFWSDVQGQKIQVIGSFLLCCLLAAPITLFHAQELLNLHLFSALGPFSFPDLTLTHAQTSLLFHYSGVELLWRAFAQVVGTYNIPELFLASHNQEAVNGLAFFMPWMIVPLVAGMKYGNGPLRTLGIWILVMGPIVVTWWVTVSPHLLYLLPVFGWTELLMAVGMNEILNRVPRLERIQHWIVGGLGVSAVLLLTMMVLFEHPDARKVPIRQYQLPRLMEWVKTQKERGATVVIGIPVGVHHYELSYGYVFYTGYSVESFQRDMRDLRLPASLFPPRVDDVVLCYEVLSCDLDATIQRIGNPAIARIGVMGRGETVTDERAPELPLFSLQDPL